MFHRQRWTAAQATFLTSATGLTWSQQIGTMLQPVLELLSSKIYLILKKWWSNNNFQLILLFMLPTKVIRKNVEKFNYALWWTGSVTVISYLEVCGKQEGLAKKILIIYFFPYLFVWCHLSIYGKKGHIWPFTYLCRVMLFGHLAIHHQNSHKQQKWSEWQR